MQSSQIFFSLVSLCLSFFLFAVGIFLFCIPNTPTLLESFKLFLLSNPQVIGKIGLALMLFSTLVLVLYAFLNRRKYFLIKMGVKVEVHEKVISALVKRALENIFPDSKIGCDVLIHRKGKVEILADLPFILENEDEVFEKIENALNSCLAQCGIKRDFILNVSFY